jgi:hypothetical protein
MDRGTMLRELDELIERTQSVVERDRALIRALPRSRLRSENQHRVSSMYASLLRRLRDQRGSIIASRGILHPKIA